MMNLLSESVTSLLSDAKHEVCIVSAFIRGDTLNFLLSNVKEKVSVVVYARWRISDIASGASDISVIDVAEKHNAKFMVHNDLHAKIYISDDKALVGSANATDGGLGRRSGKNNNLEILVNCDAHCDEIRSVLDELSKNAVPPRHFTSNDVERMREAYKDIVSYTDGGIDNWLPSSLPNDILGISNGRENVTEDALADCCVLGIEIGAKVEHMQEVFKKRRVCHVLDESLSSCSENVLPDDAVVKIISDKFQINHAAASEKWKILKKWVSKFSVTMQVIPSKESNSDELVRAKKWDV